MPAFHLPLAAAYVVITATTATIWSLLTWHIRLFIRLKIHGPFGWDDIHCTIATIFAILQSSLTVAQTSFGLGRHNENVAPELRERQEKLAWVGTFFYLLALGFSMLSVCFLIARVTERTGQGKIAYAIAVLTAVYTVICCFVIGFQCRLPTPWVTRPQTRCISLMKTWIGITVARCVLELANIVAAVVLLWSIRMPWRPKAVVLAAFAVRLLVIPPSLTRLRYIEKALSSTDWSYSRIDVVIISQISMHVSVILATVPCIRPWLIAFESGGLQAPAEARRQSRRLAPAVLKLAPLLPIAMTPPTSDEDVELNPGPAGHRKRVEAWPVQFWSGDSIENKTETTVEADPAEAKEMARKKSLDSHSSKGITRTKSFAVKFEDIEGHVKQQRPVQASRPPISQHTSYNTIFQDAGGLLEEAPKAKLLQRTNSVASV